MDCADLRNLFPHVTLVIYLKITLPKRCLAPSKITTDAKPLSGTIAQLRLRASESELAALARLETELRLLSQLIDEAERAGRPCGQFSYATLRAELDGLRAGIRAYRVSEWQQPREIEAMALESHR